MTVFLVHHAQAVGPKVNASQPLSEHGRIQADRFAAATASRGARPSAIWHSGRLRARQTAEAFWHACNPAAEILEVRGLHPGDPPDWIVDALRGESRDIMIVSHLPLLGRLLRLFLCGDPESATGPDFPPHGIVALERVGEGWVERWRESEAGS
jgi:phosphohistidine phosphatase